MHEFCALAKKICYFDPEAHFIDAETYLIEGKLQAAYEAVVDGIKIAPNYYPNKKLLTMIKNAGYKE